MSHDEATVFVVDDDFGVRNSTRWLVESEGLAVETFATAEEFLTAYDPSRPGCLVLDVRLVGSSMDGLELQSELARREIELPIIVVSAFADVPVAVRALKAGAIDLLEKPFRDEDLLDRILTAVANDAERRREEESVARVRARMAQLTPREREVLQMVVAGAQNKEIAAGLGVSMKTVEVHRSRVMYKMQVEGVVELVRLVMRAENKHSRRG
jgi:RNA polymerase sigma factor (sigma-70 family)